MKIINPTKEPNPQTPVPWGNFGGSVLPLENDIFLFNPKIKNRGHTG